MSCDPDVILEINKQLSTCRRAHSFRYKPLALYLLEQITLQPSPSGLDGRLELPVPLLVPLIGPGKGTESVAQAFESIYGFLQC